MAHYELNVSDELVHQLFQGNDDGVARLLEDIVNQVLSAQATEQLRAAPYERTGERQGYRNGYRAREFTTRVGTLELRVPRVRNGQFSTELFARYQRSEQALLLALMEMVVNGVSTRKVQQVTEELCGTQFSVSALCAQLDPVVEAWKERSLDQTTYPFVLVDALVIKVRKEHRVVPQSVLLAVGVNAEGYREILGLAVGDSESEASWSTFFGQLKDRGLHGVDLVVADDHRGLVNAVHRHFQGVAWQRCQTHLKRNILDACPKRLRAELGTQLRLVFDAPDLDTARRFRDQVLDNYSELVPRAMQRLEHGFDDATAVMVLPQHYRRHLRTTNSVERLNQEVRRRERVIRILPNVASATRLIGALLLEQDEAWATGHRYFNMDEYWECKRAQEQSQGTTREVSEYAAG